MVKPLREKKSNFDASRDEDNSVNNIQEPVLPVIRESFSGWPMIIGWIAMLIFTFHACTHMVAAGDTWVAMACGRHFVNHGVDTNEPFSANSHKVGPTEAEVKTWPAWAQWITDKVGLETVKKWHPTGWIDQNWLTHVIFYEMVPQSSYADGISFTSNILVYWKYAVYILTVICVYYVSRLLGANRYLAVVFSCFALFIGRSFLDIRPAGFSNLLVAVFLLILALTTYRNALYIWLIVPLTIFWCNVHGGYIYVFIMMISFIGLHLFICLNKKWTAIIYNVTAWPFLFFVLYKAHITPATLLFTLLVIVLDFLLIFFKNGLVSLSLKGVYHSIGALFAAFLASIVFNPFHLTNLTHTFIISVSKNAERWRDIHEWHPAFDWSNPVGTAVPFYAMYAIGGFTLITLCIYLYNISRLESSKSGRRARLADKYQWQKFDIAMFVIAALTVYMAVRSRRFIPIAGIVACPVITMLIQQKIKAVWEIINRGQTKLLNLSLVVLGLFGFISFILAIYFIYNHQLYKLFRAIPIYVFMVFLIDQGVRYVRLFVDKKPGKPVTPFIPGEIQSGAIAFGVLAVLFFGTWWGLKFKRVYLDPWPNDPRYSSVFMRMTASDAKPFYTMKFIRDNKLKGKMFNYWTEGGFIAWGEEPDPKTGFTPLQLFMDGRAQAAYNRTTFDEWSTILAGGLQTQSILLRAEARDEDLSREDYNKIGDYMDKELSKRNVWVMLMPSSIFNDPDRASSYYTFKALELHPNWRLVFFNDKQKLIVNVKTEQGQKLYDGILTGATKFPDDYHKELVLAHTLLVYRPTLEEKKQGLDDAINAFKLNPSPVAMLEVIVDAARFTDLLPQVQEFCKKYSEDFNKNYKQLMKEDGYRLKVEAARLANYHLAQVADVMGKKEEKDSYNSRRDFCLEELRRIGIEYRW